MARSLRSKHGNASFRVEVTGFRELYDALAETDKKAARLVVREITKAGKRVAVDASYRAPGKNPLSNWGPFADRGRDLTYEAPAVSAGFKVRRNNFRRRGISAGIGFDVAQRNAGGAMFEVIGDGSRVRTPAGAHLVKIINERFGTRRPRSLFPAYYAQMEGQRERIRDLILTEARKAGLR
jgi:hypothetical protein